MKTRIIQAYYRLLDNVSMSKRRFLYSQLDLSHRLQGIIGPRGAGKTTLLLQYLKEKHPNPHTALYFSADHIFFSENSLLEFIDEQHLLEGRQFFVIDEVHKYPNWNQELKNIYDAYPEVQVVFSGSSSIDLIRGSYDLSRRALLHRLPSMSFREYLDFAHDVNISRFSLDDILKQHQQISLEVSQTPYVLKAFQEYLETGCYPFFLEDKENFSVRLMNIVEKTIYEDVSSFYSLKTENLPILKKMIAFFASIQPGELSVNGISKSLQIDNKTTAHYIEILVAAGLLQSVGVNKSGAAKIRTPDKVFLDNPNLYQSINSALGIEGRIGTIRESFFLNMIKNSGLNAFYSKKGDYSIGENVFEIGGKNKTSKQIKNVENSFLIKDDILVSNGKREIPLYLFGLLY